MSDNVSVYLALNDTIRVVNEHSEAFRELDNLFVEMHTAPGFWGFAARVVFAHHIKKRRRSVFERISLVDVPPVIPGTMEIDDATPPKPKPSPRRKAV